MHILIPRTYECSLIGKTVFADIIKDLEMRSFWIVQVGPNTMTSVFTSGTERREKGHVNKETDWSYAALSRGMFGASRSQERQGVFPSIF